MTDDILVLKIFSSQMEAGMAQQVLQVEGVRAYILKDDAGGMEPHLQASGGVRLLVTRADVERANQILGALVC